MTTDRRDCRSCKWARVTTPYGERLRFGMFRCAHPVTREERALITRERRVDEDRRPPLADELSAREVLRVLGNTDHPLFRWPWAISPEYLLGCYGHEEALRVGKEAEVVM